jgi:hypothetical protein
MGTKKVTGPDASEERRRDDFPVSIKEELAKRAGHRCSNPACQKQTSGPADAPTGSVNLGVASHMVAASPLGPRADPALSPDERKSLENGIWLCQNCAKLIDSDTDGHSVLDLRRWKAEAEHFARRQLHASGPLQPSELRCVIRIEFSDWCIWRHRPDPPNSMLRVITWWREGDLRYSFRLSLRSEATQEEMLRRARVVFRIKDEDRWTDTNCVSGEDIRLPPGRWNTIEIDSGLQATPALEEGTEVVFMADVVGTDTHIERRIAIVSEPV